ncbi:uncharacterized protein LOC122643838 [Telopea speciosissima]|uniref:uncharacterized protein LOC122643838 n=1 Tax=Telopea speciosissima TaxID=54955 RepID=UPI001CC385CC|nr:uncharacterized protein LOC122643838 [Telopea speciosissima]
MANTAVESSSFTVTAVVTAKVPLSLGNVEDILGRTFQLELASTQLDPKTGLGKDTIKGYAGWVSQKKGNAKFEGKVVVPATFGEVGAVLVDNEHPTYWPGSIPIAVVHRIQYKAMKKISGPRALQKSEKGYTKFVETDFAHARAILPRMTKWDDIAFPDEWKLQVQVPRPQIENKEVEYITQTCDGQVSIRFIRNQPKDKELAESSFRKPPVRKIIEQPARASYSGTPSNYCHSSRTSNLTGLRQQGGILRGMYDEFKSLENLSDESNQDETVTRPNSPSFSQMEPPVGKIPEQPDLLRFFIHCKLAWIMYWEYETTRQETDEWSIESLIRGFRVKWWDKCDLTKCSKETLIKALSKSKDKAKITGPTKAQITGPAKSKSSNSKKLQLEAQQAEIAAQLAAIESEEEEEAHSEGAHSSVGSIGPHLHQGEYAQDPNSEPEEVTQQFSTSSANFHWYHDLLLPYVKKVREIEGTTLYGSRTLFFLNPDGTLKPIAIELTRPPIDDKPQWKQVFLPSTDTTDSWLWRLAKTHVGAHESGYHELVSHWLRTHCCTEPYIIAANRQLSVMHPIYRLLLPHFRYTMKINSLARLVLINANGIIEGSFSLHKYSMEFSSVAYDKLWRFDMEGLPADLISRGMAVEDKTVEHGVKLTIKDFPFANDGLLIWTAIKQWVSDYVNHYYPDPNLVESDQELQAWWTEVRTQGHGDKKDEPWWPVLKTQEDLIETLTTLIWVTSCHHSAVNFGQYAYGGYFPNRPSIARNNMPTEEHSEQGLKKFIENPALALLQTFPSEIQATTIMTLFDVLSTHTVDEEDLGGKMEASWAGNPVTKDAFEKFSKRMKEIEAIIDARNTDLKLKNRTGAGIVPYQLLKPFSNSGLTGMGIPNSISI